MSDTIAEPEPMEEEASGSDKIDLSLDEIIKRNKKEQKAPPGGYRWRSRQAASGGAAKTPDRAAPRQSFRAQRGAYRFQQGPNRFRYMGQPARDFYRFRPYYPWRAAVGMRGIGPLNRPLWNAKSAGHFGPLKTQFRGSYYQPYRGPRGAPRRLPLGQNSPQFQPRQRQQRQQRTAPIILNRGFLALRASGKLERWRKGPSPGSILTVSLENSKVTSEPRVTQPAGNDRSLEDVDLTTPQPKGIPLRFNFKAVSNQTGVTLNDRFTSLKIRGCPGQRSWRGRGRGRGGRMVTLQ
ncbi:UAP56-interacting factor-like isoform X2 [Scleropages formosus]|uniref:UAP56-interacting factor-like isoform X2 n=1 Tax=Scleropages formosus TaxID=113540 RepID=UPI000877EE36|nr:UAP56-interacting factor-like isoform X2 [Scleropages formosus]